MKKILLVLGLIGLSSLSYAWWGGNNWENQSDIQLSTQNAPTKIVQSTLIWVDYPPKGVRDCYTKLTFSGDNFPVIGSSVTFLSGGTTFYSIAWTTGTINDFWDFQNPLCAPNAGTTTYINVSTGNYKVNVTGFQRNR